MNALNTHVSMEEFVCRSSGPTLVAVRLTSREGTVNDPSRFRHALTRYVFFLNFFVEYGLLTIKISNFFNFLIGFEPIILSFEIGF